MRLAWPALLLVLAACQPAPPPAPASPAPDPGAAVTGLVRRHTPAGFVAAAGAVVQAAGVSTTADAQGAWTLSLPAGPQALSATLAGHTPATLRVLAPLARAHLALLPGDAPLAGVVADPRGAALPGGVVVCTTAALPAGRVAWTADADGYWRGDLPPAADTRLSASGTTPGGVPVETTTLATTGGTLVADRARPLGTPRLSFAAGLATIAVSGLPTRADELAVRVDGRLVDAPVLGPDTVRVPVTPPATIRLELLGSPGPTLSVP